MSKQILPTYVPSKVFTKIYGLGVRTAHEIRKLKIMDIPGYETAKRIIKQVKHVLEYLPILWKDRHWDYGFLFYLIDFKLAKMEQTILDNDLIEGADRIAKEIRVCRKLLKRSQNDDWHAELQDKILERRWGKCVWWVPSKFFHDKKEFQVKTSSGRLLTRSYLLPAPYDVLRNGKYPEFFKEFKKKHTLSEKKASRDLRIALKILQKYYQGWWD